MNDLALHYVARFATSAAKLESYLKRKLRERGWEGDITPELPALIERFVASGYIDDTAYARAKSASLLRRGYGVRRIGQALHAAGIDGDVRSAVSAGVSAQRHAALALARKKGLGPFGAGFADRAEREKQVAAMLRAGHPLDSARELVDAKTIDAAEEWAAEVQEDE